jgi:hypothetical protein
VDPEAHGEARAAGRRLMRDAATAADMSWPGNNPQFARAWRPSPIMRKRQRLYPLALSGNPDVVGGAHNTDPAASAQRAVHVAAVRVGRLRHESRILRSIGQHEAGLRLAEIADSIIAAVLT